LPCSAICLTVWAVKEIIDAFTGMKISRQLKRYHRKRVAGLCVRCGRAKATKSVFCADCAEAHRQVMREATGCKAWRKGGPGRPPKI